MAGDAGTQPSSALPADLDSRRGEETSSVEKRRDVAFLILLVSLRGTTGENLLLLSRRRSNFAKCDDRSGLADGGRVANLVRLVDALPPCVSCPKAKNNGSVFFFRIQSSLVGRFLRLTWNEEGEKRSCRGGSKQREYL